MRLNSSRHRATTIIEVAKLAGVSPSTISRVINGTATVAPQTEQRVREAIAALGFSPHPAARQLVTRRTNRIGVLLPEISGAYFQPMLRGIEEGAQEAEHDLLIHSTKTSRRHPLGEYNTDGIVVFTDSLEDRELQRFSRLNFPLVLMHQASPAGLNIPVVTIENKDGAAMLVSHLIEKHGRRRLVFLRGPEEHEDSVWRERGYREAHARHNLPVDEALIAEGGFNEAVAFATVLQLLQRGVGFDAIFAGDDAAAMGAYHALKRANRRIPEEVAVVGFDDVQFARYISPPLTTVRAPIEAVGREAVRQLLRLIQGQPAAPLTLLPTELVIRESCGCPAGEPPVFDDDLAA